MKTLIGYYDEKGKYIEEIVYIKPITNKELIKEKKEMILVLTREIDLLNTL